MIKSQSLQTVGDVSADYTKLKDVASDCLHRIHFNEDAKRFFETERVRNQLQSMMDLVIRTLELISQYYSKPRYSECHV